MPKVGRDGLSDAPPMPHLGRDAPPGAWPRFSDAPGGARVRASEAPPRPQWVPCAGHWTHHNGSDRFGGVAGLFCQNCPGTWCPTKVPGQFWQKNPATPQSRSDPSKGVICGIEYHFCFQIRLKTSPVAAKTCVFDEWWTSWSTGAGQTVKKNFSKKKSKGGHRIL